MSQQKYHLTVTYMDHISVFKETTLDSGEILRKNIGADFNTRAIFVEDKIAYSQEDKFIIDETIFGGMFGQDNSYGHLGAVNDLIYDSGQIISGSDDAQSKAKEALIKVGLEKRVQHFPTQLSGGEKQRVAIARAMVNEPKILFADEPTGNLDKKSSSAITDLLFSVNEQMQTTLVLVTHDLVLAEKCEKVYELSEGRLL